MNRFILLLFSIVLFGYGNCHAAIIALSSNYDTSPVTDLETARTAAWCAGRTILVTSALTQAQSNITAPWPSDRMLEIKKGGSIANSTTFTINGPFSAGNYRVFTGSGSVSFGTGSVSAINPDWGGSTDTAAVQWAVTTSSVSGWIPVAAGRKYTLTAPVTIDRAVDSTVQEFRIIGTGLDAGFYTSAAINMFSSTIAHTTYPVSEFVTFENIRFESSANSVDNHVIDGNKFLRMKFVNCYFKLIRMAVTSNFFQAYRLIHSNVRGFKGIFIEQTGSGGNYDIHLTDNVIEQCDRTQSEVMKFGGPNYGAAFVGNLFEGATGPFFTTAAAAGVAVHGNYYEDLGQVGVPFPAFKLGATAAIDFKGNYFAISTNAGHYDIDCETSYNVTSSGNFSIGNIFKETNMTSFATSGTEGLNSQGDRTNMSLSDLRVSNNISASVSLTGYAAPIATTIKLIRHGNLVSVSFPAVFGTSNSTSMTLTGVPAAWLPNTAQTIPITLLNNNVYVTGEVTLSAAGGVVFSTIGGGTFTASSNKGLRVGSITYNLFP